jgi:zinc protease
VLLNPSFPAEELEKARREVLNEIKNQEDDLARITFKNFYKTLYGNHPYGMDILGSRESVNRITAKDIKRFYDNYMTPNNLVIVIAGDVDPESTIKKFQNVLDQLPSRKAKFPSIKTVTPPEQIKKFEKTVKAKEQAHIIIGFLGTTVTSDDQYPLQILDAILSGQGGRLFIKLRDEQSIAYDLRALNVTGIDPGYFALYIASSAEKEGIAVQGLLEEIKKIKETGITEEEVERAKKYIVGNYEISLQSNSSLASNIALNEIYNLGHDYYKKYPEKINSVTVKQVNEAIDRYFDLNRYVLTIVRPEKEK